MKIAMVSEHASPLAIIGGVDAGGQNVHVAALSLALAGRGHEVTVYTRRDNPILPSRVVMAERVVVENVDAGPPAMVAKDALPPYMPAFADWLSRTWREHRPDLVHAHFWMSGKAAIEAARPLRIPLTQTFHALGAVKRRHQGLKDTSPPERESTERLLVRDADQIIATCTDEVLELLRLGADRRRIRIVPCGVDLDLFSPDGRWEQPSSRPFRILVVSRLVERKGIDDVIRALPALPETELIIAGGPHRHQLDNDPEAVRLRDLASSLGVLDRVEFRGGVPREAIPALMRAADVVVSVPWYEPFGIVPVEAMACGVPVVASAVGGQIDTVVDGVTGLHVSPREPAQVVGAVRQLQADPALRRRLGRAGATRARALFGHDRIASETARAYELLLGLAPRKGRRAPLPLGSASHGVSLPQVLP
jgi:glycosyltransferase involved in cell wall biosynthesis